MRATKDDPVVTRALRVTDTTGVDPGYGRDFWKVENLKFSEPWYRLEKSARIVSRLAGRRACTLLDIGCGPGTLGRLLSPNVQYFGIDISIPFPAANLVEVDILEEPIPFRGQRFDLIVASGLFEYLGACQEQKLGEISHLLRSDGRFLVSYTNFSHRKPYVHPAFSNVQSLPSFRHALEDHFVVGRMFPASHNWKHGQPGRRLVRDLNMYFNMDLPLISPKLAVDYFFVCSPKNAERL